MALFLEKEDLEILKHLIQDSKQTWRHERILRDINDEIEHLNSKCDHKFKTYTGHKNSCVFCGQIQEIEFSKVHP